MVEFILYIKMYTKLHVMGGSVLLLVLYDIKIISDGWNDDEKKKPV